MGAGKPFNTLMGCVGVDFQICLGRVEVRFHCRHSRDGCFGCDPAPRGTAVSFGCDPVLSQPHDAAQVPWWSGLQDTHRGRTCSAHRGQGSLRCHPLKMNSSTETFYCGGNGEF